jgi:hypothetical protein
MSFKVIQMSGFRSLQLLKFSHIVVQFLTQYHHVPDIWAACDGLKLTMQASLDDITQNMFYNGWTHGHYIVASLYWLLTARFTFVA